MNPGLKKKTCHIKDIRSYKWVETRLTKVKALLRKGESHYKDAIFIDECKLHVFDPRKSTVIAPAGISPYTYTRLDPIGVFPPSAQIKMHFILAIHRVYGIIHFQFLSSTKGEKTWGTYKVSYFFHLEGGGYVFFFFCLWCQE